MLLLALYIGICYECIVLSIIYCTGYVFIRVQNLETQNDVVTVQVNPPGNAPQSGERQHLVDGGIKPIYYDSRPTGSIAVQTYTKDCKNCQGAFVEHVSVRTYLLLKSLWESITILFRHIAWD